MKIVIVHNARIPIAAYGGTERVLWWLAKGLDELGHDVILGVQPGSQCPFAKQMVPIDFSRPLAPQLPAADLVHYFFTPHEELKHPYLITIHGNGKPGERFLRNTVFVSRNHAERHGFTSFVHNGIDPDEYEYQEKKQGYLSFCAKASWKVKNVKGAIRIAKKSGRELRIIGGTRGFHLPHRRIHWEGFVGGDKKAAILAGASGLLFPVIWNEPFGIAVVESLVSGTPVLASRMGSLPELVNDSVGRLCSTEEEFIAGVSHLGEFRPKDCREWAIENFHYRRMTEGYLEKYGRVIDTGYVSSAISASQSSDPTWVK